MSMLRRRRSIAWTVAMVLVSVTTVALGVMAAVDFRAERERAVHALEDGCARLSDQLAVSLALPVWNFDRPQIDKVIESAMRRGDVVAVIVHVSDRRSSIHGRARDAAGNVVPTGEAPRDPELLRGERDIVGNGQVLGRVEAYLTPSLMHAELDEHLRSIVRDIAVVETLLVASLYCLLWWFILRPVRLLEREAARVSRGNDEEVALAAPHFEGELEGLRQSLEHMLGLLNERFSALKEKERLANQLRHTQKLEAIGTLAAGIAHDFNNILTAVTAFTEVTRRANRDNEPLQRNLGEVLAATERAAHLIRQILTFSRPQARERKPIQLGPVVEEALALVRASLPATLHIDVKIDEPLPDVVADASEIHQIVMNLATNAEHAMRGSKGRLSVHLDRARVEAVAGTSLLPEGDLVRLTVADTGHGISEATRQRIFEPFFTTKRPGEGTGLGLSVVHGIVRDCGGATTVDSTPGVGTTFRVYLPAVVTEQRAVEANPMDTAPRGHGERVLFIDDEKALAFGACAVLQEMGYAASAYSEVEEGLQAFVDNPASFDIVISDLTMPRMTGLELAAKVRDVRPDTPIILTTGFGGALSQEKARELGIREVLQKPFDVDDLARAVERVLKGKDEPAS